MNSKPKTIFYLEKSILFRSLFLSVCCISGAFTISCAKTMDNYFSEVNNEITCSEEAQKNIEILRKQEFALRKEYQTINDVKLHTIHLGKARELENSALLNRIHSGKVQLASTRNRLSDWLNNNYSRFDEIMFGNSPMERRGLLQMTEDTSFHWFSSRNFYPVMVNFSDILSSKCQIVRAELYTKREGGQVCFGVLARNVESKKYSQLISITPLYELKSSGLQHFAFETPLIASNGEVVVMILIGDVALCADPIISATQRVDLLQNFDFESAMDDVQNNGWTDLEFAPNPYPKYYVFSARIFAHDLSSEIVK